MTKIKQVIQGLLLCHDWVDHPEISVEHDVIYCSEGPPEADMILAGWHWNANLECWEIFV